MRIPFLSVLVGMALLAAPSANAQLITGFEEFDLDAQAVFRQPSFSGSTSANILAEPNTTAVTEEQAFSGTKSLKVDFAFADNDPTRWLRLTTFNAPNIPNPTIDFTQPLSMRVFVASADPLAFALGVRETNTAAEIGANGGASGGIEWLGNPPAPAQVVTPGSWQTLVFDIPNLPVTAFAGATANGILESATGRGVLENLRINSPGTGGQVTLYIDDLRVGPVDGGVIPEPGSMALLATGLLPMLAFRRRR